jgi:transcription initiation factor TFIIB
LSNTVEAESHKILKELEKIDSSMSLSPAGTAAAAIYLASLSCGERRPQKAIAKVAGVSEVTLRNRFQFMEGFMNQLTLPRGRAPKIGTQSPPTP